MNICGFDGSSHNLGESGREIIEGDDLNLLA
jgi:hypothetical protein